MSRYLVSLIKFWHRFVKFLQRLLGIRKTVYVQDRVPYYRSIWQAASQELGFEFVPLSESIWELRDGTKRVARINNYMVQIDDPVTLDIAGDKLLTYQLLADAKLTIPKYASFTIDSLDVLQQFVAAARRPVVVKPARNTASGLGVTTNLSRYRQCLKAAALAFLYCNEALVEEHIIGESYRLLYLGNQLICASRRRGGRVNGDGKSTLAELIEVAHSATPVTYREAWLGDPDILSTLAAQGLTLQSVPDSGASILVKSAVEAAVAGQELRTVYTEDVTDLLCDELVADGRKASIAIGSEFCGVDMIMLDPKVPLEASGGVINEINTTPGLHHHYFLEPAGQRELLANTVLRHLAAKRR